MAAVLMDETKDKTNGNKERKIDLSLFKEVLKAFVLFLFSSRKRKTVGDALVHVVVDLC